MLNNNNNNNNNNNIYYYSKIHLKSQNSVEIHTFAYKVQDHGGAKRANRKKGEGHKVPRC